MLEISKIKELSLAVLEQISLLEQASFTPPWPSKSLEDEILAEHRNCYLARLDQEIIGYALSFQAEPSAEIWKIAIAKESRQKGYASLLLDYLITDLRQESISELSLEVSAQNKAAIALYSSFGFVCQQRLKNYYAQEGADGLLMLKVL